MWSPNKVLQVAYYTYIETVYIDVTMRTLHHSISQVNMLCEPQTNTYRESEHVCCGEDSMRSAKCELEL